MQDSKQVAKPDPFGGFDIGRQEPLRLDPCPERDHVFVDKDDDGRDWLTDTFTLECRKAPGNGSADVEWDDDGYGCLYDASGKDENPMLIAKAMHFQIVQDQHGEKYIQVAKGANKGHIVSMRDARSGLREAHVTTTFGDIKKTSRMNVAIYNHARDGTRTVWSLQSLYDALGLDQYRGESWRWVSNGRASWRKECLALDLPHGFEKSYLLGKCSKTKRGQEW